MPIRLGEMKHLNFPQIPAEQLLILLERAFNTPRSSRIRGYVPWDVAAGIIEGMLDLKDPFTGMTCHRLGQACVDFGRFLDLDHESLKLLVYAAYVGDLGKLHIPESIIRAPRTLTQEEREVVKHHVKYGMQILEGLDYFQEAFPVIRWHHERLDGSGYPDGLSGNQYPRLTKIFQILDIYEALTNKRSYKPPFSSAKAIQILQDEAANGWWDPGIVEALAEWIGSDAPNPTPNTYLI